MSLTIFRFIKICRQWQIKTIEGIIARIVWVENIYVQVAFETGSATMCLEREGGGLGFPVNSGSCPNAPGVVTKHQRTTRMRRRHTLKTLRRTRPVIIQTFESSSLTSHWFIPLSASPFQSLPGSMTVSVLCYLLAIRDSPARVRGDVRHPLVDRHISRIPLVNLICIQCINHKRKLQGFLYKTGTMSGNIAW